MRYYTEYKAKCDNGLEIVIRNGHKSLNEARRYAKQHLSCVPVVKIWRVFDVDCYLFIATYKAGQFTSSFADPVWLR